MQLEQLGKHPQIPELFAYFIQDHRQYLVQEYIEGENLNQELSETGAFSEDKIIKLLENILPVLTFIHQQQVIHRDIKPENIIRRKSDHKFVLVDFGAAKAVTRTALAVTGTVIGSAGYVAPEQAVGKPTFASDLYSLGVTCIHLLTNIEPFDLFDISESDWVWRDYLTVKVSDRLGQVLDKLLQQGTKKRFQTAQEVLEALQLTVKPTSIQTPQPTPQLNIELKSAKGVNYNQLEQFLKAGKWKEADKETANKMLEVAGRTKKGWLDKPSIDNFPCEDLRTIDQLWVKYSNGRFGFSIQKKIWQEVGGKVDWKTEEKLGDRVGWRKNSSWIRYDGLTYSLQAPIGHLPMVVSLRGPGFLPWWFRAFAWVFSLGFCLGGGVWLLVALGWVVCLKRWWACVHLGFGFGGFLCWFWPFCYHGGVWSLVALGWVVWFLVALWTWRGFFSRKTSGSLFSRQEL
ncbi:MAG: GUN4 domain-containing protein [Planktothrix sp.]|uniref:GUN4 domain-containing protein n=1 Tax=Planktothrix sp. TaxID=3088171 RepID=UPI0038D43D28